MGGHSTGVCAALRVGTLVFRCELRKESTGLRVLGSELKKSFSPLASRSAFIFRFDCAGDKPPPPSTLGIIVNDQDEVADCLSSLAALLTWCAPRHPRPNNASTQALSLVRLG